MILSQNKTWLKLLFAVRGSSFKKIWVRILIVTLFALVVTVAKKNYNLENLNMTTTPFTLVGVALAIFLGFRNNESYDRFWEGRKLWGAMVNVSRTFARQIRTLIESDQDEVEVRKFQTLLIRRTIAYVHSFRHHLRGSESFEEIQQYLEEGSRDGREIEHLKTQQNVPIAVIQETAKQMQEAWKKGWIHDLHYPALDASLSEMISIQGGCERIKSTPIPFTYNVLIHRIVVLYCIGLPFGLVSSVGWITPLVVTFISYAFFGLDEIGDEVEQPFGTDENHLPLHAISRMIEINLLQLDEVPEAKLPPAIEPINNVLS